MRHAYGYPLDVNRAQAEYWLRQARAKAKRCSAAVRSLIAQAIVRFRRLLRALASQLSPADRHLMTLDVNAKRNQLRDVIRQQADKLASAAAKYLTLNAEYVARRGWARKLELERLPTVAAKGYGDSPEAKRYHMRRVAEFRAASLCPENRLQEAA